MDILKTLVEAVRENHPVYISFQTNISGENIDVSKFSYVPYYEMRVIVNGKIDQTFVRLGAWDCYDLLREFGAIINK